MARRYQPRRNGSRFQQARWRELGFNLVTPDGKKYAIQQQRAITDSVIADYRQTAKTINAFLSDPAQQKLDTSKSSSRSSTCSLAS